MSTGGGAHWNPQSQRWEWAEQPPPPPPLPPSYPPRPAGAGPGGQGGQGGPGRERAWKVPLLVALGAAVVGGCAVAGWFVLGDGEPQEPKAPAAAPSASGTPVPPSGTGPQTAPTATASSSASPSVPPPYTVVRDDGGFSVAVPTGWERSRDEDGSGSFYRRPGDRSALIQIFRVAEPDGVGACELLRISSQALGNRPGYQEVSLDPAPGGSCELVYEYDNQESHGRRRAIERITVAPDGRRWALLAAGPAADGTTVRANLTAAVESFRPQ
ncbi:hypothetical protein Snoj_77810 [Streptomyces nojiriensis]|uniref:Serine/arginine repetitive matrix protein 2 n=1 Tax=Streptomyces nojiriensis TaxID=66374 RepID=A0ABQ3T0E2_9ACTN|nr:hypothetical protein [Streptomyces nojiriensis]QTI47369.1 hypothetical protein JYK04_05218 [Streptomyces nojiriensis]GGR78749.1 hypothetical protein GCM10010205_04500 [Streptomyces nojiriensis]GHI73863.1 hypothetical protein Snoj_77810 [Streptomyces nojiriensis]